MKTAGTNILGGIVLCLLLLSVINYAVKALDNPYPWTTGSPVLNKLQTHVVGPSSPAPANIVGNEPECNNESFIWRPEKIVANINIQTRATINVCAFKTNGGLVSTSNFVLLNGTKVAGRITGPAGGNGSLLAIPNSDSVVELTSSATGGSYIKILNDAYSGLQVTKNTDGSVAYKITKTSPTLRNKYNQLISIQLGSLSYSDDGNWLVVDAQGSGLIRINVKTHEILPFATGFTYGSGYSPTLQTAISNDGRYAIVASSSNNSFGLYDLNSCIEVPASAIYNCQSRDLYSVLKTQLPTLYASADKIRFITNDTFNFYATYDRVNTNNRKIGLFSLTTPGITATKMDYLAMGDSFASGEGAYSYRTGTDITDNHCHQSEQSYPYLLDASLSTGLFKSVACSGAKIKDITLLDDEEYGNDPQSKGMLGPTFNTEILLKFLPGYRAQLKFVENNSPKIITISTGGNDIGFSKIIQKCVTTANTCYQFREERQEVVRTINNTYPGLVDMYRSIKKDAAQDAKIYVIGYPQIAKPGGNCAVNVHFNNDEIIFGKQLIDYLNSVIKMAADNAGVAYIDTSNAFNGHKLCETSSSNVAVNGLTAGDSAPLPGIGPLGSESYHPNKLGHELFAQNISKATSSFSLLSPPATNATPVFANEDSLELLTSAPKDNREVWDSHYNDNLSENMIKINEAAQINVKNANYALKPNSTFSLMLYSTPTNIGTIATNANGEIAGTFMVPAGVEPGYHTLHARGEAITGEKIDIQKIIYVAASDSDFDGDGVANTNELCVVGDAINQDVDGDGIDDACDAVIGEPKQQTTKNIPDSESNPQWLLDLTAQKQSELDSQLVQLTSSSLPQGQVGGVIATDNDGQDIAVSQTPPSTVVAGVSTVSSKSNTATTEPPQTYLRQTPELAVLLVAIGMFGLGTLLVLWKLNKQ